MLWLGHWNSVRPPKACDHPDCVTTQSVLSIGCNPFWTHGRDTAIDVTVVNCLQGSMVTKVAKDGGYAVETAHSKKVKKYRERCEREGLVFLPLAVDTLGGWHEEALEVIDKLGRQLARVVGRDEGDTVQHLKERLGVVLLRDNTGLLSSRAPEAAPAQVTGLL